MPRSVWGNEGFRRAIRLAAIGHRDQVRRGSGDPYIIHSFLVARIVEEASFDNLTVIAALLHDLVEDTPITLDDIRGEFGHTVAQIVDACSEVKLDAEGRPIPWEDRKGAHLERLRVKARTEVRAVILADKLDNLRSIRTDLEAGQPVWDLFHADRDRVLWYYASMIIACDSGDSRVQRLADDCRSELERVRGFDAKKSDSGAG